MGTPLKNPPVYFTAVEVSFNTLLTLREYVPSIQESMRKAGFPDFAIRSTVIVQTAPQDGTPQANDNTC
jgi:uncharacterized protein (TIGR04255 family)